MVCTNHGTKELLLGNYSKPTLRRGVIHKNLRGVMLAQLLLAASVAFHAPLSSHVAMKRAPAPQAIGGFFGGGGDLQLFPDDVQFKDVDGDTVTLRGVRGKVDF